MKNSFHGRTLATIATGKKAYQQGFAPIPKGFSNVPLNDLQALKDQISERTAAVILEPIQGEGGIHPADSDYLKEVRALCDTHDCLLIFDEIQCGMGRTGKLYAKDHYGIQPDILTLAKGLGGGVPIGAILISEKVADAIDYGDHGTTFGGNPLVCAASLATVEALEDETLLSETLRKGNMIKNHFLKYKGKGVTDVRGIGLMIGIEFEFETKALVAEMMKQGVLANATSGNVLRLVPPLIISDEEIQKLLTVIDHSIEKMKKHV